ncbi:MAG: histidinol-phosphatase [Paludibacter sp.]|nr:histidinol-phosphatase [Paludibacter sp.]
MYWSNYHSHCTFCDGRSSMETFIQFAIAKNVRNYGFSSHAPLPFLTKWTMLESDLPDYQTEFKRYKEKYKDKINIFQGLEIDYMEEFPTFINNVLKDKKFDYLISSIHYLDKIADRKYLAIDGPFDEFDNGLMTLFHCDIKAAVYRYYEAINQMIDKGGFDIVGHVDKIALHGQYYRDFDFKALWYTNLFGDVLEKIKKKGLILEINTKSLLDKGVTYPNQYYYSLINELKIPIMVNSDCHYPDLITNGFKETYTELKRVGFKTLQQLVDGKWQGVEFDENGLFD